MPAARPGRLPHPSRPLAVLPRRPAGPGTVRPAFFRYFLQDQDRYPRGHGRRGGQERLPPHFHRLRLGRLPPLGLHHRLPGSGSRIIQYILLRSMRMYCPRTRGGPSPEQLDGGRSLLRPPALRLRQDRLRADRAHDRGPQAQFRKIQYCPGKYRLCEGRLGHHLRPQRFLAPAAELLPAGLARQAALPGEPADYGQSPHPRTHRFRLLRQRGRGHLRTGHHPRRSGADLLPEHLFCQ